MRDYLSKPRVQQAIMKASRFGPVRRNILDQIMAQEADKEQQKRLWSINQASKEYWRNKELNKNKERYALNYNANNKWNDYLSDRSDIGTGISIADLALKGGFGYNQMSKDKEYAQKRDAINQKWSEILGV
jgi:hypothetical protein